MAIHLLPRTIKDRRKQSNRLPINFDFQNVIFRLDILIIEKHVIRNEIVYVKDEPTIL